MVKSGRYRRNWGRRFIRGLRASRVRSPEAKDIIRLDSPYRFWAVQASNASGTRLSLLSAFLSACVHAHRWTCARISNAARDSFASLSRARVCVRVEEGGWSEARHGFARVYRAYESCDLAHALYACLHAPTVARLHRDDAYSAQLFRRARFDRDQSLGLLSPFFTGNGILAGLWLGRKNRLFFLTV